jgi:hypothetical protein
MAVPLPARIDVLSRMAAVDRRAVRSDRRRPAAAAALAGGATDRRAG